MDIRRSQHGLTTSKSCLTGLIDFCSKMTASVDKEREAGCLLARTLYVVLVPPAQDADQLEQIWWMAIKMIRALAEAEGAGIVQPGEGTASRKLKTSTPTRMLSRRMSQLLYGVASTRDIRRKFKQEMFSVK